MHRDLIAFHAEPGCCAHPSASTLAIAERTGYRALASDVHLALGTFLLGQGRAAEARPLLEFARAFYSNALTERRRSRIDDLIGSPVSGPG